MDTARKIELTLFGLVLLGLVFIFNSSIIHSQNVFGDPHRFFVLHLGWTLLGILGYKIFSHIKLKTLVNLSPMLYMICLVLLIFLAFWGMLPCEMSISFAPCINSANRWLVFNPAPLPEFPFIGELTLQPSEVAKLALILFLAWKLHSLANKKQEIANFKAYMIYTGLFAFLILLQPNMSTGILIFSIGTAMYFATGKTLKPFYVAIPIILVLASLLVLGSSYRRQRLMTFVNRSTETTSTAEGYQVTQVKIALGSGGLFGVGFGNSRQKYTYLPEVSTDSIFAVIGEEFGFIGSVVVLGAFLYLVTLGIQVARSTTDSTSRLCAVGISVWIGTQVLIHMAANSGLIPYTGVPLPFISYGGSSLLFSMIAMGMLINISRSNR
jgi:cell division protein FtsW